MVAYLLEIRHGGHFFSGPSDKVAVRYGAIPYEFTHPGDHCALVSSPPAEGSPGAVACQGQAGVVGNPGSQPATWVTAFTSMFVHGSFLHIFGNMLFLAIFGPSVEDRIGRAALPGLLPAGRFGRARRPDARVARLDQLPRSAPRARSRPSSGATY